MNGLASDFFQLIIETSGRNNVEQSPAASAPTKFQVNPRIQKIRQTAIERWTVISSKVKEIHDSITKKLAYLFELDAQEAEQLRNQSTELLHLITKNFKYDPNLFGHFTDPERNGVYEGDVVQKLNEIASLYSHALGKRSRYLVHNLDGNVQKQQHH